MCLTEEKKEQHGICVRQEAKRVERQQLQPKLQVPSTASTCCPGFFLNAHKNNKTSLQQPKTN